MTAAPKSPTVTREAIDYMRHDGLCGIVGGYGYCTCGMDDAKAALVARLAASTLREEGQRSGPIASGHDCPTCTAEYAIWPDAHQMVCHCQPYPWFPVPKSPPAVERGEVAREHHPIPLGQPPEPVSYPDEAWCERYAAWYEGRVALSRDGRKA